MNNIRNFLYIVLVHIYYSIHFYKVLEKSVVFEYLNLRGNEKICDVACGYGYQSSKIAKTGCYVCGLDSDEKPIKSAKLMGNGYDCHFCLGTAEMLPYKSNFFDKVVSVCALEHFENDTLALREMNRILKTGGDLVLTVDSFSYKGITESFRNLHRKAAHVVHMYTASQLTQKLREAGFDVKQSCYLIKSPIPAFFFNMGRRMNSMALYIVLAPIITPLSLLSERLIRGSTGGYMLGIRACKGN